MTPRAALSTTVFGLSAVGVAAYILLTAALFSIVVWQSNRNFAAEVLDTLAVEADILVAMAGGRTSSSVLSGLQRASAGQSKRLYYLAGPDGNRLAGNLADPPKQWDGKAAGGVFTYRASNNANAEQRYAAGLPIPLDDGGLLIIARDIEAQRAFVSRARWFALLGYAIIAVGGLALGLLASRSALSRIEQLTSATRTIMAGDLSGRLPVKGDGDEFDRLSDSVNAMLDRIQHLMQGMKEVSDNIAHDLKTPLNRLRNRAENALRTANTKEELTAGLGQTIEAADEIIKTFNALLLIARLEAGAVEETKEPVALAELLSGAAELYEPLAEEAGLELVTLKLAPITLTANRQLISQAVINLIDNAIKYARKGNANKTNGDAATNPISGRIEVGLVTRDGAVEIVVADDGPGISNQNRKRAMERFVRLDKSRSLPGTGLGLSLVAAVARLHGGDLRLEDNAPGLRAVLSLPR